ncbi:MAG: helix-turn-helix domain-containing protein [Bacteroidota bacterium]
MDFRRSQPSWYHPVQPTLEHSGQESVSYLEIVPDWRLQQQIYCYWELKTIQPLDADFVYRVVADGCIDWLVELHQPDDIYVAGLSTEYLEFPLGPSFRYLGIRFLPAGLTQLYPLNASLLTNRFERLDAVLPQAAAELSGRFKLEQELSDMLAILNAYFCGQLTNFKQPLDTRVKAALEEIHRSAGQLELDRLDIGLSPRQLRRLFQQQLGTSPKRFSKIVRFQQLLQAKPSVQSLRANKLFYDLGYYDQAHFVKEFRHHYGLPPTKALPRQD